MASEIRTNSLTSRAGLSTVTMTDSGPMFSGITTFVDNSGFTFGVGGGTSIFTPATNVLTFGTNNTEKIRIDASGHMHGVGVITATHFYGDGSNLTGITGTTINTNADNRIITGSGTANTLNGEANFTYNGGNNLTLNSTAHDGGFNLLAANNNQETRLRIQGKASDGTGHSFYLNAKRSANRFDIATTSGAAISVMGATLNVGINNAGPESLLHIGSNNQITTAKATVCVAPASGNASMTLRGGSPTIYFDGTSGGNAKLLTDGTDLTISDGTLDSAGNERFRITSAGRVGIDRTSPSTMLDIKVPPLNTATITTSNCSQLGMLLTAGGTGSNTDGHIYNGLAVGDGYAGLYGKDGGSSSATDLEFFTGSSSAVAGRLRIRDDGKIIMGGNVSQSINRNVTIVAPTGNSQDIQIGLQPTNSSGGYNPEVYLGATADGTYGAAMYFYTRDTSGNRAERVRITSGGQLLINTTTAVRALTVKDPGQIHVESTSTGNWVGMSIKGSSGTNNYNAYFGVLDSNGKFFVDNGSNGDDIIIESSASGQKQGRVLVGPSVPTSGDDSQVIIRNNESQGIYRCLRLNNQSNSNRITVTFEGGGTQTGDIRINGSTTSYNSYSDYRLKENVVPLTDPITRLKTLKPYRFNFIASPDITLDGFFAHEVSPAVAEAVGGEKDDVDTDGNVVPQALDMAKLVPLLTASLQEAITKIEILEQDNITLRARVTNLEGE